MDLHLTLFLAVLFYPSDVLLGELVTHTSPPGFLWAVSYSEPLRVSLEGRTGDIILRLPKRMPDPFPFFLLMLSSIRL